MFLEFRFVQKTTTQEIPDEQKATTLHNVLFNEKRAKKSAVVSTFFLQLNKSVSFSDTISPICLSDARAEDHTSYFVAVGWGYHYDGDNATTINTEILKESIIPLRPVDFW